MYLDKSQVTLYLALWGAVGPMVGILVGHVLSRSWQQKEWILDRRKEEFRELVSALTAATVEFLVFHTSRGTKTPQPMETWLAAQKVAYQTVADRIYIATDMTAMEVGERYLKISSDLREFEHFDEPANRMTALLNEIVEVAKRG